MSFKFGDRVCIKNDPFLAGVGGYVVSRDQYDDEEALYRVAFHVKEVDHTYYSLFKASNLELAPDV